MDKNYSVSFNLLHVVDELYKALFNTCNILLFLILFIISISVALGGIEQISRELNRNYTMSIQELMEIMNRENVVSNNFGYVSLRYYTFETISVFSLIYQGNLT